MVRTQGPLASLHGKDLALPKQSDQRGWADWWPPLGGLALLLLLLTALTLLLFQSADPSSLFWGSQAPWRPLLLPDLPSLRPGAFPDASLDALLLASLAGTVHERLAKLAPSTPHIVLTSGLYDSSPLVFNETQRLIKSILIHSNSTPLHFTVFGDNSSISALHGLFNSTRSHLPSTYAIIPVDPGLVQRRADEWGVKIVHFAGALGFAKFLLPELLPTVERVLLLDTDILAGVDIALLWRERLRLDLSGWSLFEFSLYPGREEFCSGVGLLDLRRMRRAGWVPPPAPGYYELNLTHILGSFGEMAFGDQSMFWAVWRAVRNKHPDVLVELSWQWNMEACRGYWFVFPTAVPKDDPRVPPYSMSGGDKFGLVHFNCLPEKGYKAEELGAWRVVQDWVDQYQWSWIGESGGLPLTELT